MKTQEITVQYLDGSWDVYKEVQASTIDDGVLEIYLPDEEVPNNRVKHACTMIPLHHVKKIIKHKVCTKADDKAHEAMASAWADIRRGGLIALAGYAEEGDDGGEAS